MLPKTQHVGFRQVPMPGAFAEFPKRIPRYLQFTMGKDMMMTQYDAFICERGDMAENLEAETTLPIRRSPWFPPLSGGENFVSMVIKLGGIQVEWGGYAVIATKKQLNYILDTWYGKQGRRLKPKSFPHHFQQYTELRNYVGTLDGRKRYGLVGTEF